LQAVQDAAFRTVRTGCFNTLELQIPKELNKKYLKLLKMYFIFYFFFIMFFG